MHNTRDKRPTNPANKCTKDSKLNYQIPGYTMHSTVTSKRKGTVENRTLMRENIKKRRKCSQYKRYPERFPFARATTNQNKKSFPVTVKRYSISKRICKKIMVK